MSVDADQVTYRPMTAADEPAVLELLTASMAGGPTGERTPEFFRWKHRDSPFGASPGLLAVHDERVVGVRVFLRWRLESPHGELRALRAVDTATHPDYLRRGIFKRLTLSLLSDLEDTERVDLVFNTPNADSKPGYLRMGWDEVGVLPVHVGPVKLVAFARGIGRARHANASGNAAAVRPTEAPVVPRTCPLPPAAAAFADPRAVESLLARRAPSSRLRTPLSVDYLRWRYADAPGLDYRCVPVERGGELVGLGFGRFRRRADLYELTLGDVLVADGDRRAAAQVLRGARRSNADHVSVHASPGSDVAPVTARCGFLKVPGNGISLVVNPRRDGLGDLAGPDAWDLSLGDLEVF